MAGRRAPALALAEFGTPLPGEPAREPAVVLVVGNFDGVHLGHQRLLRRARRMAERGLGEVLAVTFEPHPRVALDPGGPLRLLTPLEMRRRLLSRHGVDRILVLTFDEQLRRLEPGEFLERLRVRYRLLAMVAGPTASIGREGTGGIDFLRQYARDTGLQLEVVRPLEVEGETVTSSVVRTLVATGELARVPSRTGRYFRVLGEVEAGDGRGRTLGFPTANLRLHKLQLLPPDGVYAMRLQAEGRRPLPAVGSIGTRPHFGGGERKFEVHCLRPPGDLYGQSVEVDLVSRLRAQEVFRSVQALVDQMVEDARLAAAVLGSQGGLPGASSGAARPAD